MTKEGFSYSGEKQITKRKFIAGIANNNNFKLFNKLTGELLGEFNTAKEADKASRIATKKMILCRLEARTA